MPVPEEHKEYWENEARKSNPRLWELKDKLAAAEQENERLKDALKTSSARIKRQRMEIKNRLGEIEAAQDREKRLDAALAKALSQIVDLQIALAADS